MTLPILPSGVYRHYKGPLYFVFGYGHDANADTLYDDDGVHEAMVGNTGVHPLGERAVVVYMALELTDAHVGPRLAVRTADDFHAKVCGDVDCEHYGTAGGVECRFCRCATVPRFNYVSPTWEGS